MQFPSRWRQCTVQETAKRPVSATSPLMRPARNIVNVFDYAPKVSLSPSLSRKNRERSVKDKIALNTLDLQQISSVLM